jgi:ubiquitin fusion degradation protein 1
VYEIEVLEVRPCDALKCVSIVECDMELEFAAPLGYKEPERVPVAKPEVRHMLGWILYA